LKTKTPLKTCLLSTAILLANACTTPTHVLPLADGTNLIIIHADSETSAYQNAISDAQTYCESKHRQFVVIDRKVTYQGMDKSGKAIVDAVGIFTGTRVTTSKADDYRLELGFKCQ
jgi:hypothetical protein